MAAKIPKNKYKQYIIGLVACFLTDFYNYLSASLSLFFDLSFTGLMPPNS